MELRCFAIVGYSVSHVWWHMCQRGLESGLNQVWPWGSAAVSCLVSWTQTDAWSNRRRRKSPSWPDARRCSFADLDHQCININHMNLKNLFVITFFIIHNAHNFLQLPLATGQSWWSSSKNTAVELQRSLVRIPPSNVLVNFFSQSLGKYRGYSANTHRCTCIWVKPKLLFSIPEANFHRLNRCGTRC